MLREEGWPVMINMDAEAWGGKLGATKFRGAFVRMGKTVAVVIARDGV